MVDEQEVQKKYLALQALGQQMQQIQQQAEALEQQADSLDETLKSLDEIGTVKAGTEILVPIANGIFVKGHIQDTSTLLVNVGAHVNVPRSIPEVRKLISTQAVELRALQSQLAEQLQTMVAHAHKSEEELQKLVE